MDYPISVDKLVVDGFVQVGESVLAGDKKVFQAFAVEWSGTEARRAVAVKVRCEELVDQEDVSIGNHFLPKAARDTLPCPVIALSSLLPQARIS